MTAKETVALDFTSVRYFFVCDVHVLMISSQSKAVFSIAYCRLHTKSTVAFEVLQPNKEYLSPPTSMHATCSFEIEIGNFWNIL